MKILFFILGSLIFVSCGPSRQVKQKGFALSALHGDVKTVQTFLENGGIEIDSMNGEIGPALANAAYFGNNDLVILLLSNGAEINVRDVNGTTPLMNAVIGNRPETVELLLQKGADTGLNVNRDGIAPGIDALKLAKMRKYEKIIHILENAPQQMIR